MFYAALTGREPIPPAESYAELNQLKTQLLYWTNCDDQPNWYDASAALVFEITNRYGEDAIRRMTAELSKQSVPDGMGLKRAFKRATGDDLVEFLKTYETPWTGFSVRNDGSGRVIVTRVYPATPASRRGVEVNDVIVSLAGQSVKSLDAFASILARQKPWQMATVEVDRRGERLPMRLKLISRPTDISLFIRLSGIK
jgi:predicted metalloprotease with PDZ domain